MLHPQGRRGRRGNRPVRHPRLLAAGGGAAAAGAGARHLLRRHSGEGVRGQAAAGLRVCRGRHPLDPQERLRLPALLHLRRVCRRRPRHRSWDNPGPDPAGAGDAAAGGDGVVRLHGHLYSLVHDLPVPHHGAAAGDVAGLLVL
eukprot:761735-Hanusia_phi.AAC.1